MCAVGVCGFGVLVLQCVGVRHFDVLVLEQLRVSIIVATCFK